MDTIRKYETLIISISLAVVTLAVFWQAVGFEFTSFDDNIYVTKNPAVQAGLNRLTLVWAFKSTYNANWHPLTWISYLLDSRLFGIDPRVFHGENVLLHLANVVLLFLLLRRLTRSPWKSAFVAALFAVHPLHVESVAWVSERKDVLSTLFWILTMWAYVRYTERPTLARQLLTVVVFAFGLMAKPMLVTLPFVLLLLDYWPLNRMRRDEKTNRVPMMDLIWEKLPMFGLSFASSVVTYKAQQAGGSAAPLKLIPLLASLENAIVSYVRYVGKMFYPTRLAALYPFPEKGVSFWVVIASLVALGVVTWMVIKASRRRPYLAVGWLWYLGTLVPAIGIIQVGAQAMADRYTYVPLIGLFIMVAWGGSEILGKLGKWREEVRSAVALGTASAIIIVLAVCSWVQVGYWQDSITLFRRAVDVTKDNFMMMNNLGVAYDAENRVDDAIWAYKETVRIQPRVIQPHNNLAIIYYESGFYEESWKEVHLCRKYGYDPPAEFIAALTEQLPDPGR